MKRTNLDSFQMEELSGQKAPQYVYPLFKKMRGFNAYLCLQWKMFFHNLFRPCHLIVNTDKDNQKNKNLKKTLKCLFLQWGKLAGALYSPSCPKTKTKSESLTKTWQNAA